MKNVGLVVVAVLIATLFFVTGILSGCGPTVAPGPGAAVSGSPDATGGAVLVTARAGKVDGSPQNSDEFIWRLFTEFAAPATPGTPTPVMFETWASDADTFSFSPRWPVAVEAKRFQRSVLEKTKATLAHGGDGGIDVPCNTPGNAAVGGFPTTGPPKPCIAEEVKRNRPQYDYIVNNGLNTSVGLQAAFAKSLKVTMPPSSIAIKGDWVPVITLAQWIPQIGDPSKVKTLYYTTVSENVEYALVGLHVSSRQNPNWVWGTFEHQMNPGRCDDLGCFDTFGAVAPAVAPNRAEINTQYGTCEKTPALKSLMTNAKMSTVWENYCLKSTQVDYTAPDGTPYALGSSVVERITGNGTVAASSCIACHVYASFGQNGTPSPAAVAMLPYNPTGKPIAAVLHGSSQFDFMWGVLNAPTPTPVGTPAAPPAATPPSGP